MPDPVAEPPSPCVATARHGTGAPEPGAKFPQVSLDQDRTGVLELPGRAEGAEAVVEVGVDNTVVDVCASVVVVVVSSAPDEHAAASKANAATTLRILGVIVIGGTQQ